MMGTIRISRKGTGMGSSVGKSRKLKVYIDGRESGKVGWNQEEDFRVETGERIVHVEMDWCESRKLAVTVKDDRPVVLECDCPPPFPSTAGILFKLVAGSKDFFVLRRKY